MVWGTKAQTLRSHPDSRLRVGGDGGRVIRRDLGGKSLGWGWGGPAGVGILDISWLAGWQTQTILGGPSQNPPPCTLPAAVGTFSVSKVACGEQESLGGWWRLLRRSISSDLGCMEAGWRPGGVRIFCGGLPGARLGAVGFAYVLPLASPKVPLVIIIMTIINNSSPVAPAEPAWLD